MFLLSTLEICPQEGKGNISEKESDEIYELFQKFQNDCYQVILNNIKKVCDVAEFEFDRRPITFAFPDGDRKRMYMTWKIEFKKTQDPLMDWVECFDDKFTRALHKDLEDQPIKDMNGKLEKDYQIEKLTGRIKNPEETNGDSMQIINQSKGLPVIR